MNDYSRPTGVVVYPMTHNAEVNGPTIFGSYALMVRRDAEGKIDPSEVRMVHTEGVAYQVTEDKPWRWTDYAECATFTPDELIQCIGQVQTDLSDWIRTFGARLESNFSQAYGWAMTDVSGNNNGDLFYTEA